MSFYAQEFSYDVYPESDHYSASDFPDLLLVAKKGFWWLAIQKDQEGYDFTIGNIVGDYRKFHPEAIRNTFQDWYPDQREAEQEYLNWKQLVLADLDSARFLIASFDPPCHMLSVTCSESSERLCRKLGFYVKDGIAFWLKGSDAFNNIVPFQRKVSIPPRASRMSMMAV